MNSIPIAAATGPLAPGQLRLYCAAEPPLQAGEYWLQAEQRVEGLKAAPEQNGFGIQSALLVDAPRFRLPGQDLQLVYPPANHAGNYEESLPHAVLRTRTLPWARAIDGSTGSASDDDGKTPPWIGLLTVYAEELGTATPKVTRVSELIAPADAAVLPPQLIDAASLTKEELESQLLTIDLDLAVFRATSPALDELPLLAHVREVNTDQKEVMNMVEDGWFSVVVGNRLPQADSENTCFLVSLEGHQQHLHGGPAIPASYKTIRLVCLASWKFTAAKARGSFLDYMRSLCSRGGVDLLQPTHRAFPSELTAAEKYAREALEIGYIPLLNITRSGEQATSWYRGPLSPVPTRSDPLGPYFFSDRAIRYDQENGMFNMAYACAWQIGQLLGLADGPFAAALFQWRIKSYQQRQASVAAAHLDGLADALDVPDEQRTQAGVASLLLAALSRAAGRARGHANLPGGIAVVQPHHRRDEAQLPGVLAEQRWNEGLLAGDDPLYLLYQHLRGRDADQPTEDLA